MYENTYDPTEEDRREQFEAMLLADLANLDASALHAVIAEAQRLLEDAPVPCEVGEVVEF